MDKEQQLNVAKYYISSSKLVDANCHLKVAIISSADGITAVKYRCGNKKGVVSVDDNWFKDPQNINLAIQTELRKQIQTANVEADSQSTIILEK